jgi:hypothetical protein
LYDYGKAVALSLFLSPMNGGVSKRGFYEQAGMWRDWRNEDGSSSEDENPLRMLNMSAGQQVLRRLDGAFLQGKRGVPRFKKASRFNSVNYKPGDGASIRAARSACRTLASSPSAGTGSCRKAG